MKAFAVLSLLALLAPATAGPRRKRIFRVYTPDEIERLESRPSERGDGGRRYLKKNEDKEPAADMSMSMPEEMVADTPTTAGPTGSPTIKATKKPKKPKKTDPPTASPAGTDASMSMSMPPTSGIPEDEPTLEEAEAILTTTQPTEDTMEEVDTPALTTPAPITPAPVSPAPVTPAPITPAPITPAPVTPSPVTPSPVTPVPTTPSPTTPSPSTPSPSTPELTEAPSTAEPTASEPVPVAARGTEPVPVVAEARSGSGASILGTSLAALGAACIAMAV